MAPFYVTSLFLSSEETRESNELHERIIQKMREIMDHDKCCYNLKIGHISSEKILQHLKKVFQTYGIHLVWEQRGAGFHVSYEIACSWDQAISKLMK